MPMLDAYIPEGALSPSAERELLAKITDLLLEHEGVDPSNERARPLAWVLSTAPRCTWPASRRSRRATASSVRSRRASMTTSVVLR